MQQSHLHLKDNTFRELIRDAANSSDIGFFLIILPSQLLPGLFFHVVSFKPGSGLSEIRGRWDLPRPSRSDIGSVSLYHDALQVVDRVKGLDKQTWEDLNLNDVFTELDHTNSAIGQQVLYHILSSTLSIHVA